MSARVEVKVVCDSPGCRKAGSIMVPLDDPGVDFMVDGWQLFFFRGLGLVVVACPAHQTTRAEVLGDPSRWDER